MIRPLKLFSLVSADDRGVCHRMGIGGAESMGVNNLTLRLLPKGNALVVADLLAHLYRDRFEGDRDLE
jgi:hypothetical protein